MKKIKVKTEIINDIDLDGDIDDVINTLKDIRGDYYERGINGITIDVEWQGYEGGKEYNVTGFRWETDAELNRREARASKAKAKKKVHAEKKKKAEYDMYVELCKKFKGKE